MRRLAVSGFFLAITAVALASRAPPVEYNVSIYTATPVTVWLCLGLAVLFALVAALTGRIAAGALLGVTVLGTTISLPLFMGWYMIGRGDAMSHIGYSRDLLLGNLEVVNLLYPFIHVFALTIYRVSGIKLNHALLLVSPAFVVLFSLGVTLATRELARKSDQINTELATVCGIFSALLLLPVNHMGVNVVPQPTSQGVMLFGFLVYLVTRSLTSRGDARFDYLVVGFAAMTVFVHPLHSIVFASLLVGLGIMFFLSNQLFEGNQPFIGSYGYLAFTFTFSWTMHIEFFNRAIVYYLGQIVTMGFGQSRVSANASALNEIGTSVLEIGLRLFGIPVLFVLLTGFVTFWALCRELRGEGEQTTRLLITSAATLLPLAVATFGLLLMWENTVPFRLVGVLMVFGTIFGALTLARLGTWAGPSSTRTRVGISSAFAILLLASSIVIFPSPLVLEESGQVTKAGVESYRTIAESRPNNYIPRGVRTPASRYWQAIYGVEAATEMGLVYQGRPPAMRRVPDHFSNRSLTESYAEDYYLNVHKRDRVLDPGLYQGFRYNDGDFAYLDQAPGISKYYDSEWVTAYRVKGNESST